MAIVFIPIQRSVLRRFPVFLAIVKIFADEAGENL
jgi:hypothetical protein